MLDNHRSPIFARPIMNAVELQKSTDRRSIQRVRERVRERMRVEEQKQSNVVHATAWPKVNAFKNRYPLIELCTHHEPNEIRQRQVCRQLVMTCRSIYCVHGLSPESDRRAINFSFQRLLRFGVTLAHSCVSRIVIFLPAIINDVHAIYF